MTELTRLFRRLAATLTKVSLSAWRSGVPFAPVRSTIHGVATQSTIHTSENAFAGAGERGSLEPDTLGSSGTCRFDQDRVATGQDWRRFGLSPGCHR
ncbi:MAG: hypothetical protein H6980_07010 [Gammaproteobacteria bacterium]|nr:hypothetical protein [Gammaproteobacteria bacterium]